MTHATASSATFESAHSPSAASTPSETQNSALAGTGRPQNSSCCVVSMLNLARRSAEQAATTKSA